MENRTDDAVPLRHLMREVAGDVTTLVRKEIELSRQELEESFATWIRAVAVIAAATVLGTGSIVLVGFAAVGWLDDYIQDWLASLLVAGAALLGAVGAVFYARRLLRKRPLVPEKTRRSVQEDLEWAKAQLKR